MRVFPILGIIVPIFATGCANTTQEIRVPVMVQCVKEIPQQPKVFSDAELKAMPDGDLVLGLAHDRLKWRAFAGELVAVLEGCK